MNPQKQQLTCPNCDVEIDHQAQYCPICGLDFLSGREGAGPVTFKFPQVISSFQEPEVADDRSKRIRIFLYNFWIGIIAGPLLALVQRGLVSLFGKCFGLLTIFVAVFVVGLLPGLLGYGLGNIIGMAVYREKYRNQAVVGWIGAIIGAIGFLFYLATRYLFGDFNDLDISAWLILTLLWQLITLAGAAAYSSAETITKNPLCMNCQNYLTSITFGKWHLKQETSLIEALTNHTFDDIEVCYTKSSTQNYTSLTLHHCRDCHEIGGYLSATSFQARKKYQQNGKIDEISHSRQIYFSTVTGAEVDKLLEIAKRIGNILY